MTRPARSALIVSDSAPMRRYVGASLEAADFACTDAASGFEAMDRLPERVWSLYVLDLDMPASAGLTIFAVTLMGGFRDLSPTAIGIAAEPEKRRRGPWSEGRGLAAILAKPFRPEDVLAAAYQALEERERAVNE